jgi:adenosine kinase
MNHTSALDFDLLDPQDTILIVSPGNLRDMIDYPRACRARGIEYIFDPGQSLPMLEPVTLLEAIEGASILISNDYELDLIIKKTGLTKKELLGRTGTIITTLGELGSRITTLQGETGIPTAKPREVLDPTGAGDSYRGGLISGLIEGREITHCARLGSVCASFAVECYGTQEYTFNREEFEERLRICNDGCGG